MLCYVLLVVLVVIVAFYYKHYPERIITYYALMEKEFDRWHNAFFNIHVKPKLGIDGYEFTEDELIELRKMYIAFMIDNINNNKILRKFISNMYSNESLIWLLEDRFTKEVYKLLQRYI